MLSSVFFICCRFGKNRELSLGPELLAAAESNSPHLVEIFNKISPFIPLRRTMGVAAWDIVNGDWMISAYFTDSKVRDVLTTALRNEIQDYLRRISVNLPQNVEFKLPKSIKKRVGVELFTIAPGDDIMIENADDRRNEDDDGKSFARLEHLISFRATEQYHTKEGIILTVRWYRVERNDFGVQRIEDKSGAVLVTPLMQCGVVAARFVTRQVLVFTPFGDEDHDPTPSPKSKVVYDKRHGFQPYIKKVFF